MNQGAELSVLFVEHGATVVSPTATAARVNAFLGGALDEARMAQSVDPVLYRQKGDVLS